MADTATIDELEGSDVDREGDEGGGEDRRLMRLLVAGGILRRRRRRAVGLARILREHA